jgi:hypothetical protein
MPISRNRSEPARGRRFGLGLYAALVLAVPLVAASSWRMWDPGTPNAEEATPPGEHVQALAGIWWRYDVGSEGDPLRFYYFHGDGKGLYRYGRVGLTNTHSFDYDVIGDELRLHFRKTGDVHDVRFRLERNTEKGGRDWLVLHGDPREEQDSVRYFRDHEGPIEHAASPGDDLGPPPAGHMWIDMRRYATGGAGFHFYQLRPAGIDGRGVGWYHRGDFDDWSTESLVYRITGNRLEFWFSVTGEAYSTRFEVRTREEGRALFLHEDPRDYWHPHTLLDAGPSFGTSLTPGFLAEFGSR